MCERCRQIQAEFSPEEIAAKAKMAIYMAELSMQQVVSHLTEFIEYGKVAGNVEMPDLLSALLLEDGAKKRLRLTADFHRKIEHQTNNPA
ncbi:hypothetical protein B9G55_01290 [Saccharibacillus sp. O16]|nr:hypothetical protein B9G55_01290 [Saccharibacillus sp. O16]